MEDSSECIKRFILISDIGALSHFRALKGSPSGESVSLIENWPVIVPSRESINGSNQFSDPVIPGSENTQSMGFIFVLMGCFLIVEFPIMKPSSDISRNVVPRCR